MKRIILLTDYKDYFGSKWDAIPYNSGFDKELITKYFAANNYKVELIPLSKAKEIDNVIDIPVLYTSSEDIGYHYKDFIEDIIYYLELKGANVIPRHKFLRANNNKVFMELLRNTIDENSDSKLKSWVFGTYEDLLEIIDDITYPIVVKTPRGAMSRGVSLAKNKEELISNVKSISRSKHLVQDIKDNLRPYKHKGYKVNSLYREKFILQEFVPDLINDWKILIYGKKYFVLTRHVGKGDFRASGSHNNYLAGSKAIMPEGLLDFAHSIYQSMDVPHLSIDVIFDGDSFRLIEFQALYFGTSTVNMSDVYFEKVNQEWKQNKIIETIEELYVNGVVYYIGKTE